jgi:hypothetical protein
VSGFEPVPGELHEPADLAHEDDHRHDIYDTGYLCGVGM